MSKLLRFSASAAAALSLASAATGAGATVLGFDDIGSSGAVPSGYGGLDWSASAWIVEGGPDSPNNAHSGSGRAVFDIGQINYSLPPFFTDALSKISFASPTVFLGAWFAGASGATVTFELFSKGALVATSRTLDATSTPTFLASGYAGAVDGVIVSSPNQGMYAMDDFTFSPAVPEPATAWLLGAGVCLVACALRRRARS